MQANAELYSTDFVILKPHRKFYEFEDGEIIIYPTRHQAEMDSKDMKNATVISCTRLTKKLRRVLRRNIEEHNKLPF